MKLLVTGANGQLGWELAQKNQHPGLTITALSRAELDITQAAQVNAALIKYQPDLLINTAAYTAVDKAEQEPELAFAANNTAAAILAQACAKTDIPLLHLSTDYVFPGTQQTPYKETDPTQPINVYGASKLAGEIALQAICKKYIILRVSGVFSAHGNNFVKTILRLAQEKENLRIVADQIICPTPAADIAETLLSISQTVLNNAQPQWGTYHYCSNEPTTWHHFTEAIVALAHNYKPLAVKQITPITTAEYPTPAKRPAYSVLDCNKLQLQLGIQLRSWRPGLTNVIQALLS